MNWNPYHSERKADFLSRYPAYRERGTILTQSPGRGQDYPYVSHPAGPSTTHSYGRSEVTPCPSDRLPW